MSLKYIFNRSEHSTCCKSHPGEIHYVFSELTDKSDFHNYLEHHNNSTKENSRDNNSYNSDSSDNSDNSDSSDNSNSESTTSNENSSENNESDHSSLEVTSNILVIGRLIDDNPECNLDPTTIQLQVPTKFFEYDGSLTTSISSHIRCETFGTFLPVRWIIDDVLLYLNIDTIIPIAKSERPLQELNGRIILFNC